MNVYGNISNFRLIKIKVILDDEKILYEGEVDEVPENIKKLKYSKVEIQDVCKIYVYSSMNEQ